MIRIIAVVSFIFLSFGWGNVQECTQCHEKIVHEWSTSAHAMAHKTKNELFAKMLGSVAKAKGVESSALETKCNLCHAPVQSLATEGVGCAACHSLDQLAHQDKTKPPVGKNNSVWLAEKVVSGPTGEGASPYHKIVQRDFMKESSDSLCLSCHNVMKNEANITVCTTGPEHHQNRPKKQCVECHMGQPRMAMVSSLSTEPKMVRPHTFHGARNSTILKDAVELSLDVRDNNLTVSMMNRASHAFPTGTAARGVVCVTEFFKNETKLSTHEEKLGVKFLALDGNVTLPPLAVSQGEDNRLKPLETRKLALTIPQGTTKIVTKIFYRLANPVVTEKLGLIDPLWSKVHLVATKEVILKKR